MPDGAHRRGVLGAKGIVAVASRDTGGLLRRVYYYLSLTVTDWVRSV